MSGKKKFLIVALIAGVVLLLGVGVVSFIAKQERALHPEKKQPTAGVPSSVNTQEEKIQVLADVAPPTKPVSSEENIRTLENLSKQSPKNTTSEEEKLRILQSLKSSSTQ